MTQAAINEARALQKAIRAVERGLTQAEKIWTDPARKALRSELEKPAKALRKALDDLGDGARLPSAQRVSGELSQRLDATRAERTEVDSRRGQLHAAAREGGWPVEFTGAKDFVGPFTIEHRPTDAAITFGKVRLQKLKTPSGAEVLAALEKHRATLEAEARKGWDDFMRAAFEAQHRLSPSEEVPWPEIVAGVIPEPKARKKATRSLLYRLSMLVSAEAPGGRKLRLVPPTLAEQRAALTVPRLNRANDDVRIYRVRLL